MAENKFKYGLGYIQSPADPRDAILNFSGQAVPESYEVKDLTSIYDQGNDPICAAVCLSTILTWRHQIKTEDRVKLLNPYTVYDLRPDKNQWGMILRDTIKQIKRGELAGETIQSYARITDPESAKVAITLNGPLVIGTFAYNDGPAFYKPAVPGAPNYGGHATLLTGFDKNGFTLRNSWGYKWNGFGYTTLPYEDWGSVLECWTILI